MRARALAPIALAVLVGVLACLLFARPATTLPPDFVDSPVTNVPAPTALAFTPDGRMLVTSKSGQLRVYKIGALLQTPALNLGSKVCDNSERGLLGVAVDPNFDAQAPGDDYVYLYYTFKKHRVCPVDKPARNDNPVNRVSRFTMSGDTADPDSEKVLIDNIPSPNGNHNAGDLKFGKDDYLYISVGDGGCNFARPKLCQYDNGAARYRHVLLGKILRVQVNPNGTTSIPPGNPYTGPQTASCADAGRTARGKTCQEIFALGFRNPFRFAVDPDAAGTVLRVNDVGGQRWEEIDEVDAVADAGAHYGWNLCEGRHHNPERPSGVDCNGNRYTGPIHEYSHNTNCESITGGALVPNDGSWPDEYDDSYLFADFVCGKIFELTPDPGVGFSRSVFTNVPGPARPVAMTFGPYGATQALYYTTFDFTEEGPDQVRRIAYTGP